MNEEGEVIRKQRGGPAFYLERTFRREKVTSVLKTGPEMEVKILVAKTGELGMVSRGSSPQKVRFSDLKTPFLLISTVLNEFDLTELPQFRGFVFLDVQGYVRNGSRFGKKKLWRPTNRVFSSIFCLKGTGEELKSLPDHYLETQRGKILITTNGKSGCEIFTFGKRDVVKPKRIVVTGNTVGAGDTFFANFISHFTRTMDASVSARYAVKETSVFLSAISSCNLKCNHPNETR